MNIGNIEIAHLEQINYALTAREWHLRNVIIECSKNKAECWEDRIIRYEGELATCRESQRAICKAISALQ